VLTFRLAVTDDLGLADATPDEVVITVNNQAPIADAGPDQDVDANILVTLDGSGSSDPDNHLPLTYGWTQTGGPAVSLSDPTDGQPSFTAPGNPAVLTFSLIVTDSLGLVSPKPDEGVITVSDSPIIGLAAINSSPTVLGNATSLTATLTGGTNASFSWDFGDGQTGSGATPSHTYSAVGSYTAVVTASNSFNLLTATTVVTVTGSGSSSEDKTYYFPFIFSHSSGNPDLVVQSFNASSSSLTLTIKNIGKRPVTHPFWIDVYFNPSQTPGLNQRWDTIAPAGAVWGVMGSGLNQLAPGKSLTLASGGPYYFASKSSSLPFPVGAQVYVLVDSINYSTNYGNIRESNESNNLLGPVVSTAASSRPQIVETNEPSSIGLPER
jgi:PKD repeat protein